MPTNFTIVIPAYNRADLIGTTIRSFLNQDYPNFEIVVVDDGSKDNTREVVEAFSDPRVRYFYKENGERGAARNYGGQKANGNFITFFDSDDVAYPYFLSHAAKEIETLNQPGWYAQAFEFRKEIPDAYPALNDSNKEVIDSTRRLQVENFLACNGVFIRKDVFEKYQFSDNRDLSGSEDWVLWLQLAANYPCYYSPVVCSCLVDHVDRGEMNIVASKLVKRLHLLMFTLHSDKNIRGFGKKGTNIVFSSSYLFAALKLSDFEKYKMTSVRYLLNGFFIHPGIIFRRSFFTTLKKIAFSWRS